ncbi:MAG: hypothetical protein SV760_09175 [Halobacteria archaeon]|nr:hypothetical protein [Halobacteria archaeon]
MDYRKVLAVLLATGIATSGAVVALGQQAEVSEASGYSSGKQFTRIDVSSSYRDIELLPGKTRSFNVTVTNNEDSEVSVNPHLYVPSGIPVDEKTLKSSWVTILNDGETTLESGESREFEIEISVPEGTEPGRFYGFVAFTDEKISRRGFSRPFHAARLSLEVRSPVRLLSESYLHGQIKAGSSFTHGIKIKNSGSRTVEINPKVSVQNENEETVLPGGSRKIDRSWITVHSPDVIGPNEEVSVKVTVAPPESAPRGEYEAQIDLGIGGNREDESSVGVQETVSLNLEVWKPPSEPFTTSFDVTNGTEKVKLRLEANSPERRFGSKIGNRRPAEFDVEFVSPSGETVEAKREKTVNTGSVDLGNAGEERRNGKRGGYADRDGEKRFVFSVEDPTTGKWKARITPHNTIRFEYRVIRLY